jgi:hypothetical protein
MFAGNCLEPAFDFISSVTLGMTFLGMIKPKRGMFWVPNAILIRREGDEKDFLNRLWPKSFSLF